MKVVHTIEELRDQLRGQNRAAFVPTMGNLHDAHLALMNLAHQHGDLGGRRFCQSLQVGPMKDFDHIRARCRTTPTSLQRQNVSIFCSKPTNARVSGAQK